MGKGHFMARMTVPAITEPLDIATSGAFLALGIGDGPLITLDGGQRSFAASERRAKVAGTELRIRPLIPQGTRWAGLANNW